MPLGSRHNGEFDRLMAELIELEKQNATNEASFNVGPYKITVGGNPNATNP